MKTTESLRTEHRNDPHSYANPGKVRVLHLSLDLEVDFEQKSIRGFAAHSIDRVSDDASRLILDTRDLTIERVETSMDGETFQETSFELGEPDSILGAPLGIVLPANAREVRVHYSTDPGASGLQWLDPSQTAGKKHPFLYSQSQAIHARSWIPLQDTPGVRVTYDARVQTPQGLLAVMSAAMEGDDPAARSGEYRFDMPQPIPSYLIALAVGDLAFKPMSARTAVYAEPSVAGRAAKEFEDTEEMMQAAEQLYGPYRWGRYDILVLPPSFPYGGMENPRLTFATPTILAGDKSLVSLVAHELAHSWSGNLVSNATWSDFWLNEGFTVYLENRIQEVVFSPARAEMEAALEVQQLKQELAELKPQDQILHIDLKGRDPDAAVTSVPYVKGMLFLRSLEEAVGRAEFDSFLRGYFGHFAFQSVTTVDFLEYLDQHLLKDHPRVSQTVPIQEWVYEPGLPDGAPQPVSDAFAKVGTHAEQWLDGKIPARRLPTAEWTTQEWLHFLRFLPETLEQEKLRSLDEAFGLTNTGNAEIVHQWLLIAIRNRYEPAYSRLEEFLTSVGRRKFLRPLYQELVKTPEGKQRAVSIYQKARGLYHPISASTIDEIVLGEKK